MGTPPLQKVSEAHPNHVQHLLAKLHLTGESKHGLVLEAGVSVVCCLACVSQVNRDNRLQPHTQIRLLKIAAPKSFCFPSFVECPAQHRQHFVHTFCLFLSEQVVELVEDVGPSDEVQLKSLNGLPR